MAWSINGILRVFRALKGQFMSDVAIDLGTCTTLIYVNDRGIVLNEPTVVAIDTTTGKCLAAGDEAKKMLGRTPGEIKAIRPMKDGVIADFQMVELLLRTFIEKVQNQEQVWQTFINYYQLNKEVQLEDIPSLQPLIKEIFIEKKIQ